MYEPPIHKLLTEIETNLRQQEENAVLQAVVSVGVNVDKEELIKALQYDRGQYEKGYEDGCRDSRKHGEWTTIEDDWNEETIYQCSVCKEEFVTIDGTPPENLLNYCTHCGAKMDGGNENG